MDDCLMVLKRSIFEMPKQGAKKYIDPSYGYEAIYENVPKLHVLCNCAILEHFRELHRNHNSD